MLPYFASSFIFSLIKFSETTKKNQESKEETVKCQAGIKVLRKKLRVEKGG